MLDHPSKVALSDFVLGKLPSEAYDQVAAHLDTCPRCQDTVQMLDQPSDTLLMALGKPASTEPTDDACRQAMEAAAATTPGKLAGPPQPSGLTRTEFLAYLRTAGIVPAELWREIESDETLAAAGDGAALAGLLVQRGILTQFQAEAVGQGKTQGLVFGEYIVLDQLGAGGMGQVFRARHQRMERIAALKVISPAAINNPESIRRFQREVKAAARLIHPNIVTAFDAGEQSGMHFLVMEYVDGQNLSDRVKTRGPLPWQEAIDCVAQTARGLAFAHSQGVVHRDIKPANLLRDAQGTIKILDMGLARFDGPQAGSQDDGLTLAGSVMGTVDYMAPEQAFNTRDAGAPADVYSLGCTLYRLLSGQPLYEGATVVEKILAHREKPIPPLRQVCPTVPEALIELFKQMVSKDPAARPSMAEVVSRLVSTASAAPVAPQPRAAAVPPWRRRSVQIATAAAGSLALLWGVIVIFRGTDGKELGRVETDSEIPIQVSSAPGINVEVRNALPSSAPARNAPPQPAALASGSTGAVTTPKTMTTVGNAPAPAVAPFDAAQARAHQEAWAKHLGMKIETTNSVGQTMILIPPGEFLMGSTDEQVEAALKTIEGQSERIEKAERPQHQVAITKPFLMSATEITIGEFKKFSATGYLTAAEHAEAARAALPVDPDQRPAKPIPIYLNPGYEISDDWPASFLAWDDAIAFCQWLSEQEQATYRLPTEAEWEYACRAGTTTQFSFGDDHTQLDQYAWYKENADGKRHPVSTKLPGPFGLFDMHGNMAEWCSDFYDQNGYTKSSSPIAPVSSSGWMRVVRGGSWFVQSAYCRSACRNGLRPTIPSGDIGFRVVRELNLSTPTTD